MLSENRVQKSVAIVDNSDGLIAEVLWVNQIIKDDVVISEAYHRCAYTEEDRERFITEVVNAELYLAVLGWE
jgi:hypothetical protein